MKPEWVILTIALGALLAMASQLTKRICGMLHAREKYTDEATRVLANANRSNKQ